MAPASGFVVLLCLINVHNVLAITGNTTRSPKATIHSSNDFQVKWWDQIDNSSKVPTRPQQVKTEQFNSTHPPYKQLGKILSAIFRHGNGYATTSRKPEHRDRRGCLIRTWRPNLMQFKIIDDMNENYPYTTVNPLIKGIRTSYFNVWKNEFSTEGFYLTPPVKTRPIKNPWLFMIPVMAMFGMAGCFFTRCYGDLFKRENCFHPNAGFFKICILMTFCCCCPQYIASLFFREISCCRNVCEVSITKSDLSKDQNQEMCEPRVSLGSCSC